LSGVLKPKKIIDKERKTPKKTKIQTAEQQTWTNTHTQNQNTQMAVKGHTTFRKPSLFPSSLSINFFVLRHQTMDKVQKYTSVIANILYKQSRTADKGWLCRLGSGRGAKKP